MLYLINATEETGIKEICEINNTMQLRLFPPCNQSRNETKMCGQRT